MTFPTVDRMALSALVHRYAAYLDDREFDSAATLFTEDAVLEVPEPPASLQPVHIHRGRTAITAALAAVARVDRTEHAIVGEVYDQSDDASARGRVTCIAHHWSRQVPDDAVGVIWHLRYDDRYHLAATGWRISRRVLTINAIETRPVRRMLPRQ